MRSEIGHSPGKRYPRLVPSSIRATTGDAVDAMLIARIGSHDRAAMRTLYTRHHSRIRRFILRFVADEAVADGLVQAVFLDVWRAAGRFAGHSPVSTWLLAIARHEILYGARAHPAFPALQRTDAPPAM